MNRSWTRQQRSTEALYAEVADLTEGTGIHGVGAIERAEAAEAKVEEQKARLMVLGGELADFRHDEPLIVTERDAMQQAKEATP